MTQIKLAPFVDDARGKMGNAVFSKIRHGNVMRGRVVPHNPNSDAQALAKNYLSGAASAWDQLSAAQVKAWNAYAATLSRSNVFGVKKKMTGFNLFVAKYTKFCILGITPPTDLVSNTHHDFPTITLTPSLQNHSEMLSLSRPLTSDEYIIFKCSPFYPVGVTSINKKNVPICHIIKSTDTFPIDIAPFIINKHGNPPVGLNPWIWKIFNLYYYQSYLDAETNWEYAQQCSGIWDV